MTRNISIIILKSGPLTDKRPRPYYFVRDFQKIMQNQLAGRRLRVTAGGFNGRKKVPNADHPLEMFYWNIKRIH